MIETRRLKNVVIFIQTILTFLRIIYFAIFDFHVNYVNLIWDKKLIAVSRIVILQKKALKIMNF